ncbi:TIGR03936 family radical SAM-associated protein [Anaerosalibacter bizertensis]|uniref:TIGR03936 family radical SAM-associated protein n=1 Tax=Anaerosalibacter bizertensis TaxID=932217 RepID=UPI001C0EC5BC|nr:TIGR03936 family radical SAM-associated protein [Anaerosalibacter bizertensis]MBU5294055.1 TIGR03936 family radical SAM-associated protein [Anaerosalibacter bizertensis]MBV1817689.1 TIGR03936 family radical SAM-associated protein [Bacteroidales bacterium MSK.15.36]MCB5559981.1 TIGR03936 family radical SAM-associated protein [Anaerosalibacter bizertensis]
MILRVKFTKENYLKYISHLDLMRLFQRAFRKADIPMKYSEGFNPHPKFSIASALSLGVSSIGEYMDVELEKKISITTFIHRMNQVLPDDIKILKAEYIEENKSVSSMIDWGFYKIQFKLKNTLSEEEVKKNVEDILSLDEIIIIKQKKKKGKIREREKDIRPFIGNVVVKEVKDNLVSMEALLKTGDSGNLKAIDFLSSLEKYTSLNIIDDTIRIHRLELYTERHGEIVPLL